MASKTEGIALLSMYNDEEEEEEEEEGEEEEEEEEEGEEELQQEPSQAAPEEMEVEDSEDQTNAGATVSKVEQPPPPPPLPQDVATRTPPFADDDLDLMTLTNSEDPIPTPSPPLQAWDLAGVGSVRSPSPLPVPSDTIGSRRSRTNALSIVDYGHDDTAMSPEAEESVIVGTGRVVLAADLQKNTQGAVEEKNLNSFQTSTPSRQPSHDQTCEQPVLSPSDTGRTIDAIETGAEISPSELGGEACERILEDVDPLDNFLPPPPTMKCCQALQDKINKFLAFKKSGKRFNAEIRKLKEYRNPDFLQHAVTYQGINQTGTCFSKDVFDPEGYDSKDYYDEIEADMRREIEKRDQERKRSPKVDFISGGTHTNVVAPPKINGIPVVSVSAVSASGQQAVSADAASKDVRPNKKSKWDKVDNDSRNPLQSGGHDNISTVGAHAALLSVSGAGAGYTAFAQQKRKEAEDRRTGERKLEKRS